MTIPMILAPLFVLVLMTFVLSFFLAGLRVPALTRGEIRPDDVSLRQPNWPKPALQVGYSFQNQFELPLLFYVLTILATLTKHATAIATPPSQLVPGVPAALEAVIFRAIEKSPERRFATVRELRASLKNAL